MKHVTTLWAAPLARRPLRKVLAECSAVARVHSEAFEWEEVRGFLVSDFIVTYEQGTKSHGLLLAWQEAVTAEAGGETPPR